MVFRRAMESRDLFALQVMLTACVDHSSVMSNVTLQNGSGDDGDDGGGDDEVKTLITRSSETDTIYLV